MSQAESSREKSDIEERLVWPEVSDSMYQVYDKI